MKLNIILTFFCRVSTQSVTATQMFPLLALRASRASSLDIVPDKILEKYTLGLDFMNGKKLLNSTNIIQPPVQA